MYHRREEANLGQLELHHQELDSEDSLKRKRRKFRQHSLIYERDFSRKAINLRSDRLSLDQIYRSVSVGGCQMSIGNFYLKKKLYH